MVQDNDEEFVNLLSEAQRPQNSDQSARAVRFSLKTGLFTSLLLTLTWLHPSWPFRVFSVKEEIEFDAVEDDPTFGCGLVGDLPGINRMDGEIVVDDEMQRLIDALKVSSSYNKVSYWNWGLAPYSSQPLSSDFIFMPENWGSGVVTEESLRPAGQADFLDADWVQSPAEMSTILLGMNEPDMKGSCMDYGLMGICSAPCSAEAWRRHDCPPAPVRPPEVATPPELLDNSTDATTSTTTTGPPAVNKDGQCRCSSATSSGFWPVAGCSKYQPLPELFTAPWDWNCIDSVLSNWRTTASNAARKGYKYLSTPLIAMDLNYARSFIKVACGCDDENKCKCQDISCGCPVYVGFHWYAADCRPKTLGGYDTLRQNIQLVGDIMEDYPFVKGAILNEVGMLNCDYTLGGCVEDSGIYPASSFEDHTCPSTDELPNGLASFMDDLFDIILEEKTKSGRAIIKGVSWFNENEAGGTYNLQLFDEDGKVNKVGEAYMRNCRRWGDQRTTQTS